MDEETKRKIVKELINRVEITDFDKSYITKPLTIEYCYIDNDRDIEKTVDSMYQCILWRRSFIELDFKPLDYIIHIPKNLFGVDIIYINCFYMESNFTSAMKYLVNIIEEVLLTAKDYVVVVDMHKSKSEHFANLEQLKDMINIFKKYYPFHIRRAIFLNVSPLIKLTINILIPFMSSYMKNRIHVYSNLDVDIGIDKRFFESVYESIDNEDNKSPKAIFNNLYL